MAETVFTQKSIPTAVRPNLFSSGAIHAKSHRIDGQTDLDHILYNDEEIFYRPLAERKEIAFQFIQASFTHHYIGCETYRRLCDMEQFTPEQLREWSDLPRIPLVPSSIFKHRTLRTLPEPDIIKVCLSSGTQGSQSQVPRDHVTLERFIGSTGTQMDLLLSLWDEMEIFNLGPDTEEAAELWFAYVMSILDLVQPTTHYVREGIFYPAQVIDDLRALPSYTQPLLTGPPILFLHLLSFMERQDIRLDLGDRDGRIVTAGGWKRFNNDAIGRDALTERLVSRFGLSSPAQVRDAFNMVELNTVILECEYRRKHIPPWLVIIARDPGTLAPIDDGTVGLLSYIDPTADSYPAFILSDDFGHVRHDPCRCGRTGPTLEIVRRVKRIEARGCALKMDIAIEVRDN